MNDKQFTDELFKRMYDLGYRKVEIRKTSRGINDWVMVAV